MTKSPIETRQRIMEKPLTLFNENGIEYAGMRELAAALDMHIGNVTYYFPTKDDLVFALSEEYSSLNSGIHTAYDVNGIYDFLKKNEILFENRVNYQCLLLSMVHIMQRNSRIAKAYEKVKAARHGGLEKDIVAMVSCGSLSLKSDNDQWFLVSVNSLVGRFWMSEAALSVKRASLGTQAGHYLRLLAYLFKPYATKSGLKEIESFLKERGL